MGVFEAGLHHDRAPEAIAELPTGTQWAVAVEFEYERENRGDSIDGILSHNGKNLRLSAWSGRLILDNPLDQIVVLRSRNGLLHIKTELVNVKFGKFQSLKTVVEDCPDFAAPLSSEDPFGGLLSWLPSAGFVVQFT